MTVTDNVNGTCVAMRCEATVKNVYGSRKWRMLARKQGSFWAANCKPGWGKLG